MPLTAEYIAAIEDTDFTPELTNALFAKANATRATAYLQANGHVVKPTAEFDTAVATAAQTAIDLAIKQEGARFFGDIDTTFKEIIGEEKPAGMKTTDWIKSLKGKITVVKEGDPISQGQIDTLQKELQKVKDDLANAGNPAVDVAKETNKLIRSSIKGLEVPIPITATTDAAKKEAQKAGINTIDAVLKSQYEYGGETENGEPYFIKKGDTTKKAIVNSEGEPLTAAEIVTKDYPNLIAVKGHKQSGGGTQGNAEESNGNTLKEILTTAGKLYRVGSDDWKKEVADKKAAAGIK